MTTEAKAASQEQFKKLCEIAGLTDEQMNYCRSITVHCEESGVIDVDVKYYKFEEEK